MMPTEWYSSVFWEINHASKIWNTQIVIKNNEER